MVLGGWINGGGPTVCPLPASSAHASGLLLNLGLGSKLSSSTRGKLGSDAQSMLGPKIRMSTGTRSVMATARSIRGGTPISSRT